MPSMTRSGRGRRGSSFYYGGRDAGQLDVDTARITRNGPQETPMHPLDSVILKGNMTLHRPGRKSSSGRVDMSGVCSSVGGGSMNMMCPDDIGRESWVWVMTAVAKRACLKSPQVGG